MILDFQSLYLGAIKMPLHTFILQGHALLCLFSVFAVHLRTIVKYVFIFIRVFFCEIEAHMPFE